MRGCEAASHEACLSKKRKMGGKRESRIEGRKRKETMNRGKKE